MWLMSTVTWRAAGALPVRPVTVMSEVTAAPAVGDRDDRGVLEGGAAAAAAGAGADRDAYQASWTALYSALLVPYSSPATARVPVRAPA